MPGPTDIATLGFNIDSTAAALAAQRLKDMGAAAGTTKQAQDNFQQSAAQLNATLGQLAAQQTKLLDLQQQQNQTASQIKTNTDSHTAAYVALAAAIGGAALGYKALSESQGVYQGFLDRQVQAVKDYRDTLVSFITGGYYDTLNQKTMDSARAFSATATAIGVTISQLADFQRVTGQIFLSSTEAVKLQEKFNDTIT